MDEGTTSQTTTPKDGSMPAAVERRVFINDQGEATFICPMCNTGVIRDLRKYSEITTAVRLKCKCRCGHVYRVLVERRSHFRKPVNLAGLYMFTNPAGVIKRGVIKIRDISQSGLKFTLNSPPEFRVGDTLTLEFTLDDHERSQVCEEGVVKYIRDLAVGIAFETTEHYGKLGHYLFR